MRYKPALCLYLVLCLAFPLLGAESFPLTAGKFKVLLSPIGGKLMSLEYAGVTYSQPLSNNGSFYDRLYFSSEQKETMEDFGKLRYEVESWRSDAKGAEVTFTVCGVAMLNFIRLHKTYQFPAQGDTCKITYTLTNLPTGTLRRHHQPQFLPPHGRNRHAQQLLSAPPGRTLRDYLSRHCHP